MLTRQLGHANLCESAIHMPPLLASRPFPRLPISRPHSACPLCRLNHLLCLLRFKSPISFVQGINNAGTTTLSQTVNVCAGVTYRFSVWRGIAKRENDGSCQTTFTITREWTQLPSWPSFYYLSYSLAPPTFSTDLSEPPLSCLFQPPTAPLPLPPSDPSPIPAKSTTAPPYLESSTLSSTPPSDPWRPVRFQPVSSPHCTVVTRRVFFRVLKLTPPLLSLPFLPPACCKNTAGAVTVTAVVYCEASSVWTFMDDFSLSAIVEDD